ncbi:carbohydrate ABC transporter permease [Paenibacillus thiaminolyticus]|uniref:Carbohydrate ABC transporter permease n=1 Tax=Paenibacillus thiaminolyticus TaxID=49283 RepID=A0AAP9IZE7_PANTH|nr:carbohydrate ABC transporter permease [Paenibacillus thiaminolyticus]MCY9537308.1 carbohydrate ABC transporter permease [Paenibacillus thiaminolyticus]MCY9603648.1 carbohydrate ABC transporter permease [Paenibacillus thiaminolyticus]MCY9606740.1 carbohydrate ABC transporter permease [Paenibacillus thiaminolyticus]MCY9612818.1 carbohydrate ABC transporter permease [Paenibacillus thiaminolyticus]MCY9619692.1 carbohydrate ABC transporter permease [Paenibacillus thiaminolyticus]
MSGSAMDTNPKLSGDRKKRMTPGQMFAFLLLIAITVTMLFPLVFMVSTALKTSKEMLQFPPTIIPQTFAWDNFKTLFTDNEIKFGILYKNSLIIAAFSVFGTVLSSSLVAYGFSRFRARGKKLMFMLMISTMMLPYPAVMIPQFLLFSKLGWMNTFLPLTVPTFFGSAYQIFLLRQFFMSLPNELYDSGKIDGCGEFRMFWNIALPLSGPALATVAIFTFIWTWNDLLGPVLYLSSQDKFTLPVGLAAMMSSKFRIAPYNLLMCASIMTTLPVVAIFAVAQKRFTEGIVLTGIK